jgi:hypothetical protein
MKKVIVTTILFSLLFGAVNLFAQEPTTGLTGKGVKLGLNLAKFTGSDAKDVKMRTGLAFGGFITYSINDLFAIQPEVYYAMKGAKEKYFDEPSGLTIDVTEKLDYIEIPVLFRVQLAGGTSFKPNFYAGPELGILLSAKVKGEASGVSVETDIKDNTKSTDFGLIGGVGAEFPMGNGKLLFDIRYDAGLAKVVDASPAPKINNSAITFLVGYGF